MSERPLLFRWRDAFTAVDAQAMPAARRLVLWTLSRRMNKHGVVAEPVTVAEIAARSGLAPSTAAVHLRAAEASGWVTRCSQGGATRSWRRYGYTAAIPAVHDAICEQMEGEPIAGPPYMEGEPIAGPPCDGVDRSAAQPHGKVSRQAVQHRPKVDREPVHVSSLLFEESCKDQDKNLSAHAREKLPSAPLSGSSNSQKQEQAQESEAKRAFAAFQVELCGSRGQASGLERRLRERGMAKAAAIVTALGGAQHLNLTLRYWEIAGLWPRWLKLWRDSGPEGPPRPTPAERRPAAVPAAAPDPDPGPRVAAGELTRIYREARSGG